jgi:hypothetical protein
MRFFATKHEYQHLGWNTWIYEDLADMDLCDMKCPLTRRNHLVEKILNPFSDLWCTHHYRRLCGLHYATMGLVGINEGSDEILCNRHINMVTTDEC